MSTLTPRGAALAAAPSARDLLQQVEGSKYDPNSNPTGWVNLGTAENHCMLAPMAAHLGEKPINLTPIDYSYGEGPWGVQRLRAAFARHMNERFKPVKKVVEGQVLVANGVTSVCDMLAFALAEPGDGVLMSRPIYQAFPADFGVEAGVESVWVEFGHVDQFAPEAVECYERALLKAEEAGTKIRALLLCNPHNPTGRCYPRETVVGLMRLCQEYKVHLLADEIYAMSVYETTEAAEPFESVLAFESGDMIDERYLHVIYGMSKDFGTSGLRMGCVYTQNEELWAALNGLNGFHWVGIADQRVAIQILEDEKWLDGFFDQSRKNLEEKSALTRTLLEAKGVKWHRGANAGFFMLIDLRSFLKDTGKEGWDAEEILADKMMKAKVFVTPGSILNAEEPGWFRIIFSQEEYILREGFKRFFSVLDGK